ncbi:LysR family transcriptional regulator ArgP [Asaia krungthepensis]|uniref:Transcriptional regulator n=1 Tax=Asaia krungthepensis NRIC 0535 TaxID=1307925 RepID=A0ABQ0Q0G1_9PROT|nr:LysR family transcriptional regulator ArgP [Asaia krungthepensis]GBQ86131.1 transcriptional regulator [Asaia krungthepensis NRIC 0535]
MLDYASLSAVSAVIREGSFEAAARALRVTPSAISQRVRSFEERLGAHLIIRGQPCTATELGALLAAHVDKVRELEDGIMSHAGLPSREGTPVTTLRLAVNADSLATWVPDIATRFAQERNIRLDLVVEDESLTVDRLRSGEVAAAVTAQDENVAGCRSVRLGTLRYIACATPLFRDRYFSQGLSPEALQAAPCICFDQHDSLQRRWLACHGNPPLPAWTHHVPSTEALLHFTLEGLGWALHPMSLALDALANGSLVEIDPSNRIAVNLYWIRPRIRNAVLEEFTHHLMKACAAHPALR